MLPADHEPPSSPYIDPAIERWNQRYRDCLGRQSNALDPHPFLLAKADLLPASGRALDIAGGLGRNSLWLARRGLDVTVVDGSKVACEHVAGLTAELGFSIKVVCRDLKRDELPSGPYDLIVNTLYLQRTLVPRIEQILAGGGLLLFATYLESGVRGHASGRFGLKPGELASLFPRLEAVSYGEHKDLDRPWAGLVARKPSK